jgi:predicted permease
MSRWTRWLRRGVERDFEREMAAELEAHVAHRADDLMRGGLDEMAARRQARLELGSAETHKESMRDERAFGRSRRVLEQTARDLRLAARRFASAPGFAIFGMLSIGLGAGVTTGVISVLRATMWAPTGVAHDGGVALVGSRLQGLNWDRAMSDPDFADYARAQRAFAALEPVTHFYQAVSIDNDTLLTQGDAVSGTYFSLLGVRPAAGRLLDAQDDRADAPGAVVVSEHFWRVRLAGDPDVVGRRVRIGGVPMQIVGIAPRAFRGWQSNVFRVTEIWISRGSLRQVGSYRAAVASGDERSRLTTAAIGRLASGVTAEQASAEAADIGQRLDAEFPVTNIVATAQGTERRAAPRRWLVRSIGELRDDQTLITSAGVAFVVIVGLLLVVACTNLANLALARGAAREAELGLRLALGASRARVIRELLAESAIVGAGGLVAAIALAVPLLRLASANVPVFNGMSMSLDVSLDRGVFVIALAAVLLSLLVCGLWPAVRLTRTDVRATLARGAGATPVWRRGQWLVGAQVFVAVAFFAVAAVFIAALTSAVGHDSGVDLEGLRVARTVMRVQAWDEARARRAVEAITSAPGTSHGFDAVAVSSSVPFGTNLYVYARVWAGAPDGTVGDDARLLAATPGIFRALGVRMAHGRAFDQRDGAGAEPVIVLSEGIARTLFGTADAVGRRVTLRGSINAVDQRTFEERTVIGIAADTDTGEVTRRREGVIYVPFAQRFEWPNHVLAHAASAEGSARALRSLIHARDEDVAVESAGDGDVVLAGEWVAARWAAAAAASLGGATLFLSMTGLFGVLSGIVQRRMREFGVRKALGARAADIWRLVALDGARPVLVGAGAGLVAGLIGATAVRAALPSHTASVPLVVIAVVLAALVPALAAACYLPLRRAVAVDPNVALRDL